MTEQDLEQPQASIDRVATAGARLRAARERLGLSRADIAARTKIAERHLAAVEDERFSDLASRTYAVGFARAYARVVGLDEREVAQAVRSELDRVDEGPVQPAPTFEPGDPARVPSSRTAWLAGVAAIAVVIGILVFWGSYYFPAMPLPDLVSNTPSKPAASKPVPVRNAPTVAATSAHGQVVVTAKEAGVWVKVSDATGKQLYQKQMALGESYAIPADVAEPRLRTGRPDALAITIGGRAVPPLADKPVALTAPVSAAALLTRGQAAASPPIPEASKASTISQ
jgi:transcriptional regulator with XRE-family HTH domain